MTDIHQYDLVCIGSGPAGQRAAVQASKLGRKVAVVEKQQIVGGVRIGTGTIPSKTFREAVFALGGRAEGDGRCGRRRRPPAEILFARVADVIEREAEVVEDQLARNDIDLIRGAAAFEDPHTLTVRTSDGWQEITADHFLVAVGTEPAPPPGARELLGVHTIGTGATELIHIGQAVIGLGGGLDYFIDTVFNYPTLAECYKVAAFDALNKLSLGIEAFPQTVPTH